MMPRSGFVRGCARPPPLPVGNKLLAGVYKQKITTLQRAEVFGEVHSEVIIPEQGGGSSWFGLFSHPEVEAPARFEPAVPGIDAAGPDAAGPDVPPSSPDATTAIIFRANAQQAVIAPGAPFALAQNTASVLSACLFHCGGTFCKSKAGFRLKSLLVD